MGKKCVPGLFCIENMTLFLIVVLGLLVVVLFYRVESRGPSTVVIAGAPGATGGVPMIGQPYTIPPAISPDVRVAPPIRMVGRGVPIQQKTSSAETEYSQVGILTNAEKGTSGGTGGTAGTLILPLMGRNLWNGRDKWQYYTMSNTGTFSTKLPVSVKGRSCTGEYGCDSISNGDRVYVEGYGDIFRATLYENGGLQYLPF